MIKEAPYRLTLINNYYKIYMRLKTDIILIIRGCTGFDGGLEIVVAIRRLGLRHQLRTNINANDNYELAAA